MSNVLDLKNGPPLESPELESEEIQDEEDASPEDSFALDAFEPKEISWRASLAMDAVERRKSLYMMGGLVVLALATAYVTKSILLAVIAGLSLFAWEVHHRAHSEHEVHIHKTGIRMNGHDYPFRKLHSFAIHEMPDETRHLSLKTASRFSPHLRIPLTDTDHEEVRTTLAYHLDEDDHPISLSDVFLKS